MKTYLLFICLLISTLSYSQTSEKHFNQTIKEATASNKAILLVHVNSEDMQSLLKKELSALSETFKIHFLNVSREQNDQDKQDVHNRRYDTFYNPNQVYPTLNVLDKSGKKTGVHFSGTGKNELQKFITSLKAY